MPIVVNFVQIFLAMSINRVLNIPNKQKIGTEKIRKEKINYYDVILQILQFAPKLV